MTAFTKRRKLLQLLVAAVLCVSLRAVAGEPEAPDDAARHQAKTLRDQGANAAQAHDFAVALDCFERAYTVYPSANLLFNIGVALDRLQRSERAVAAFEEFLASATDAPAIARDFARERVRHLEPGLGRLRLLLDPPNASVQLDGVPLYASLARPIPVAPGVHTVVAMSPGRRAASITVELSAGATQMHALHLAAEEVARPIEIAPATAISTSQLRTAPAPAPAASSRLRWAGVGLGSFGLSALIVGAGLGEHTGQLAQQVNHPPQGAVFDPTLVERGRTSQTLEIAFITVGGAAVAGGLAMLIAAPRRGSHAH
jgi:tetratricopeptide (TPR) repeat protein